MGGLPFRLPQGLDAGQQGGVRNVAQQGAPFGCVRHVPNGSDDDGGFPAGHALPPARAMAASAMLSRDGRVAA